MLKKPTCTFDHIFPKMGSNLGIKSQLYENVNSSCVFDKIIETSQELMSSTSQRMNQTNTNLAMSPTIHTPIPEPVNNISIQQQHIIDESEDIDDEVINSIVV